MIPLFLFNCCLLILILSGGLELEGERHYHYDEMVVMRDGISLHTVVFLPNDPTNKRYPAVVDRSPYGYNITEWLSDFFLRSGYVAIGQDLRGQFKSQGDFSIWHSDANDSEDTGNWIVQQEWSNGEVYTIGASADGIAAMQMPLNKPAWLKGQYLIWSTSNLYAAAYQHGTYMTWFNRWFERKLTNKSNIEPCKNVVWSHESYDDYWQQIDLTTHYDDLILFPSGFYAGWYDLFITGNLLAWEGYYEATLNSLLFIDPIGHCQDASKYFDQDLVAGRSLLPLLQAAQVFGARNVYRNSIENITFYVMSSDDSAGNYWTSMNAFPETNPYDLYLHAGGIVSIVAPLDSEQEQQATSSYIFDPSDPVPTIGGNNLGASTDASCGPLDQSILDTRSDILRYQTKPFEYELIFTGPLFATLFVSSNAIDTDFMVKISDVNDKTGVVRILVDNALRMRWRNGGIEPILMSGNSDDVYEISISLWNTSYVLPVNHSLRVDITSSNYPRFSINPNNGNSLADTFNNGYDEVNVTATNTIYHSLKYPSRITLPVLVQSKQDALPKIDLLKLKSQMDNWLMAENFQ